MIRLVPISALYASLSAILILVLAARVSLLRRVTKTGLGDGGDEALARAIRAHANAIEYVPIILLLLLALELNGVSSMLLHGLGGTLIVARALHGWGLSRSGGLSFGRWYGTALTWLVLIAAAALNLIVVMY